VNRALAVAAANQVRKVRKRELWNCMWDGASIGGQAVVLFLSTQVGHPAWLMPLAVGFASWSIVSFRARLRRTDRTYDELIRRINSAGSQLEVLDHADTH
jgi:hypothetical protein